MMDEALQAAEIYHDEHPEDLLNILALSLKAKAQVLRGELDDAEATTDRATRIVAKLGERSVPPYHLSRYLQTRALLAVTHLERAVASGDRPAQKRTARAARWWRKSLEEGTRLGARPELARTHLEVGRRLTSLGRDAQLAGYDANGHLGAAEGIFAELGLAWDAERSAEARRSASGATS